MSSQQHLQQPVFLRQVAKTKEEFFTDESGRRWFKTGDIAEVRTTIVRCP